MGPLLQLVGDKEQNGNPTFLYLVTDITHQLTENMLIFYVETKT